MEGEWYEKLLDGDASKKINEIFCRYLKNFDYKKEDTLPPQVLQHIRNGRWLFCGDRILSEEFYSRSLTGYKKEFLDYLWEKGYSIGDRFLVLYFPEKGKDIYYDKQTGKRIGDEIGINDWFLKE